MISKAFLIMLVSILTTCWCFDIKREDRLSFDEPSDDDVQELEPNEDLNQEASKWENWRPIRLLRLDTDRTITRRESSLVRLQQQTDDGLLSTREQSTSRLLPDPGSISVPKQPKASIEQQLVTILFESMLPYIFKSCEVIFVQEEKKEVAKVLSDEVSTKKRRSTVKLLKSKSKSKIETEVDLGQASLSQQCWWNKPDEKVKIEFINGNLYEGEISLRSMHGNGRFQWADGTAYMGKFQNNEIHGRGTIYWKDNTWYDGDFIGNVRHGNGLYVDSRQQRSYMGQWYCGTKHGNGTIYYSKNFKNSYSGDWVLNTRNGMGAREFNEWSGYKGEWDHFVIHGKGLMIWPNHDFYTGEWKEGLMSGFGFYIWNTFFNNSMTLGSINAYRGEWLKGERHGKGFLNCGFGLGSHYKGEFKNNKKHGAGEFLTNTGLVLQDENLFIDDNIRTKSQRSSLTSYSNTKINLQEPFTFEMCDDSVGLVYHIEKALGNIDRDQEERDKIIEKYLKINFQFKSAPKGKLGSAKISEKPQTNLEDLIAFEESSLIKAIKFYETRLKTIYFQYANICNVRSNKKLYFPTVLIRLYLWQLYFDCDIHRKGLTLVEIDNIFHSNPGFLTRTAHNPFEEIYYWQFVHSLISISSRLYAKRQLPDVKPNTILESAFRMFMENDILTKVGMCKGQLLKGFGQAIPLKGLYNLYCALGEPHSVRTFLSAVRKPPHETDHCQPSLIDAPNDHLLHGHNAYEFGDEMCFILDGSHNFEEDCDSQHNLLLFNFGNLSSKKIIKIFGKIFPQIYVSKKIMNLEIQMTFLEFFEAFVFCALKSVKATEKELLRQQNLDMAHQII